MLELTEGSYRIDLLVLGQRGVPFKGFPCYKHSPPEKKELTKSSLLQIVIPTVIMLCITITINILLRRGLFVVMSIISTLMRIIASVTKYVKEFR